jgi:hypothetical protein
MILVKKKFPTLYEESGVTLYEEESDEGEEVAARLKARVKAAEEEEEEEGEAGAADEGTEELGEEP